MNKIVQTLSKIIILSSFGLSFAINAEKINDENLKYLEGSNDSIKDNVSRESLESQLRTLARNNEGRIPRTREDLELLLGTWNLSYTTDNSYTDKIIIVSTEADEIGEFARGFYYENQTDSAEPITCYLNPAVSDLKYNCVMATLSLYKIFMFNFSGNTITTGYYAQGTSYDELMLAIDNKSYPISGYRISNDVYYNDETGELVIPKLKFMETNLRVILQNEGNFLFSVKEYQVVE